jgi:hypothetical protein
MSEKAKKTRYASLSFVTQKSDGEGNNYTPGGAIVGNPEYKGSATVFLDVEHPTRKDANGYPLKGKLVAAKFLFPADETDPNVKAEETFVSFVDTYISATFWKPIEAKPRKQD